MHNESLQILIAEMCNKQCKRKQIKLQRHIYKPPILFMFLAYCWQGWWKPLKMQARIWQEVMKCDY